MKNWERFEIEATEFLNSINTIKNLNFKHEGGSDSGIPDIKVMLNKKNIFNIEAKLSPSQAGQFVVHKIQKKFVYSEKNKEANNDFSKQIIGYMNKNYENYSGYGTHSLEVNCPKNVAFNWIMNHYEQKNSKFVIVSDKPDKFSENFIKILPLNQLEKEFNIVTNYRIKRSGTRKVPKKDFEDIKDLLRTNFQDRFTINKDYEVFFEKDLVQISQPLSDEFYLSKKNGNKFVVKKRSQTFNANIIFQLIYTGSKSISGFKKFFKMIEQYDI